MVYDISICSGSVMECLLSSIYEGGSITRSLSWNKASQSEQDVRIRSFMLFISDHSHLSFLNSSFFCSVSIQLLFSDQNECRVISVLFTWASFSCMTGWFVCTVTWTDCRCGEWRVSVWEMILMSHFCHCICSLESLTMIVKFIF